MTTTDKVLNWLGLLFVALVAASGYGVGMMAKHPEALWPAWIAALCGPAAAIVSVVGVVIDRRAR